MFEKFIPYINKHNNIVILPHDNEDGDALGSCFALRLVLLAIGKNAHVELTHRHKYCDFLFGADDDRPLDGYTLAIAVDCADVDRMGERSAIFEQCDERLVIDHHATNKGFGMVDVIDGNASACGELIYKLALELGVEITPEIATDIYLAISSDSGGFRYSNTTPETMRIGAALLECGAKAVQANEMLFESQSVQKFTLMRNALDSLEVFNDGKICVVSITYQQFLDSGAKPEEMDGIVTIPRSLDTADIAIFLREKADGTVKVSMRCNENADVSKICAYFGGGGHVKAAGCTLDCSLEEAKNKIIERCTIKD